MDLRPIPSEAWQTEYESLMDNPWLANNLDREKRIAENYKYIGEHLPEMALMPKGVVYDIGPGPGEFLEIARQQGHAVVGIDAETGDGGMGNEYLRVSRLMAERQGIPVRYVGFEGFLSVFRDNFVMDDSVEGTVAVINLRGSIEQCLSNYMTGESHDHHHMSDKIDWKMEAETKEVFSDAFDVFARLLRPGGILLIHANGTGSTASKLWYDRTIRFAAERVGLDLAKTVGNRLHKWEKPCES